MDNGLLLQPVISLQVGDPAADKGNIIGPIINDTQLQKIVTQVDEAVSQGANLETGMCHIYDSSVNDELHIPFGGVKDSGMGRLWWTLVG